MTRILAALLAFSTLARASLVPGECDACELDQGKVRLCRPHAKEESANLKQIKKAMRSKQQSERAEALEQLADLSAEHANAPSQKAAERIADFLEEGDFKLRVRAVEVLLDGQHPDVVVETLTDEVAVLKRDWKKADGFLADWFENQRKGTAHYDPKENAEFMVHLRVLQYGASVLQALGKLPDERASEALVEVLGWPVESTPAQLMLPAARSAIELGNLEGLRAVVGLFAELDDYLTSDVDPMPYGLNYKARTLGEGLVQVLARRMLAEDYTLLVQDLRKACTDRGLSGFPGELLGEAQAWEDWLAANEGAFPVELGVLQTPVTARIGGD